MRKGYFCHVLRNDILETDESDNLVTLLKKENLNKLWSFNRENGDGVYVNGFPDDMAVAVTSIKTVFDSDGRLFRENYTRIAKYDAKDSEVILNLIIENTDIIEQLTAYNRDVLGNPCLTQ